MLDGTLGADQKDCSAPFRNSWSAAYKEADIIILHEMFENVWNHTIEEILVEFSLRGAVVVFSEHGEESLMKLPMHSYDLSGRCVGW